MRHRAGVLGELRGAQATHLADTRRLAAVHVGAEFLVAENRQSFLQRELEPVTAGDAVAGPVVEILVRDNAVDVLEVRVSRHVGARQHVLGVEDVEPLVLHRPHVEITDGDDHVVIEVALQAEGLLVPLHRFLERRHGVRALVELARLDIDRQLHVAPGGRAVGIAQYVKLAGDECEEVTRFLERIFPRRVMTAARLVTAADRIAVGEQEGERRLVGMNGHRVARHHVRPVDEPRDASEALRFALGEVAVAAAIEAGKLRVLVGLDTHARLQQHAFGQIVQRQAFAFDPIGIGREHLPVHAD